MKQAIFLGLAVFLAGCGGSPRERADVRVTRTMPMASGPISEACLTSGRADRSRRLCGCIQAAADQTLTGAQQRRSIAFYNDPHLAQKVRQSDRTADKRFWDAYAAYGKRAELLCT